ncbi:MAG TPA: pirin family protein [Cytophagales bacterium]|nr:pirin family protein [Cytophagales bacterium]
MGDVYFMRKIICLSILGILRMAYAQDFVVHKSADRGFFRNSWLQARYSFSFNTFYNEQRDGFGALLVLNDDVIAPGKGFGKHSHENMEIVTIPLEGTLRHTDSKGNQGTLQAGEVQVMTAGKGIRHAEFNASKADTLKTLQIWINTDSVGRAPRYAQRKYGKETFLDTLFIMVSPHDTSKLYIHQNASLSMGYFRKGRNVVYHKSKRDHGVYVFVIQGKAEVYGVSLLAKDAIGIIEKIQELTLALQNDTRVLLIEVPMSSPR